MIETQLIASGIRSIAGVDEAGRGACAGPLVVAAVILKDPHHSSLDGVKDSKALTAMQRETLYERILENALSYSIIEISPSEID